jgi:dihydrofolate synthase/folylpolyglutamate synthase
MTYEQTVDYLYRLAPMFQTVGSAAYKEGMENSFLIDKHLGCMHRRYATIHVAGTNGKGSVSHLLASVLQEAGYRTGLYTSPHLLDFRERIRVDGQMIDKEYIVDFVARHRYFMESVNPSFFEITTGMALRYFADRDVDIAVIEVGLGGRLDCTNVITPVLSIITNISFDHTALLGNRLIDIAREKAGIIKPGVPVVVGEARGEVREVFEQYAEAHSDADVYFAFAEDEQPILRSMILPSGRWLFETVEYGNIECELGGFAQEKNAATALCAVDALGCSPFVVKRQHVYDGFLRVVRNTGLMGRWQVVGQRPKIVLDTGHNASGIEYNVCQLRMEQFDTLHIVFGMVSDKDIQSVLAMLPKDARYYFTQASVQRALDAVKLLEMADRYRLHGEAFPTVADALGAAKRCATERDVIFVGGSTFVVADALRV